MAAQLPPVVVQPIVPPIAPPNILPPVAVAPPAIVYHLYPGRARDPNSVCIDFTLKSVRKMHKSATTCLIDKYNLSPGKLQRFLNRIKERISQYGWDNVVNIAMPNDAAGDATPPINLVNHYGQVSVAQIRNHANVYMYQNGLLGQQSVMLHMCLRNSLKLVSHNLLDLDQTKYTVNGEPEGALFPKEIITKAYVNTNATIDTIRKSISKLDIKMKELNFDVKSFNGYVQTQVNAMAAHGATCLELITNLLEAYYTVKDDEFEQHVRNYYFHYTRAGMQGRAEDLTSNLMLAMEQHYHCCMNAGGTWSMKPANKSDKERIIALEATIDKLNKSPAKERHDPNNHRGNERGNDRWAWKKVCPVKGKPTMVKKNRKTYHWCPKHQQWTIHTPAKCKLNVQQDIANSVDRGDTEDDDNKKDSKQKLKMHIDPALSTVTDSPRYFA